MQEEAVVASQEVAVPTEMVQAVLSEKGKPFSVTEAARTLRSALHEVAPASAATPTLQKVTVKKHREVAEEEEEVVNWHAKRPPPERKMQSRAARLEAEKEALTR